MKHVILKCLLLIVLALLINSCEKKEIYLTKDQDDQEMSVLMNEINTLSQQYNCENASEWKIVAIGAKACGGPSGFIAYSTKIEENLFLKKVTLFTEKQNAYNVKWGIVSDCSIVAAPKSVECVKGKPIFVY